VNPAVPPDRVLDFYRECRLENQRAFYQDRAQEYETANTQLSWLTMILLVAAFAAGLLSIWQVGFDTATWGIVAAVCSALVAAIAGWGTLIGFQQNAKLYRGAAAALDELGRRLANPATQPATILKVEEVLQSENGQWGRQLTADS